MDQSAQNEGRLLLAKQAIEQGQFQSNRRAAKVYDANRETLRQRRRGRSSRRNCVPNSRKLTDLEESVIIQYILDLDSRGFSPKYNAVRDMANNILATRSGGQVGIKWPENFVKRIPELKPRFKRKYDYRRAQCEDPELINDWFKLVQNIKAKYGIVDEDTYNFDEIGFMMGIISTGVVITGSERRHRPKALQPGNREWVTVIQGINSAGWAIPPFIIFAGRCHLGAWYEEQLPRDWKISLSDNGWTTNENGVKWIKHFEMHTKNRIKGVYRLLIIDGHESHDSFEFKRFCQENNIITLCMPSHSSHLLQPLDVGCFSPLKKAYGKQVEDLMRYHINHITKLEFLPAFKEAFYNTITSDNIRGAFRGAGLIPFSPETVLSKLEIKLKTPTPPPIENIVWASKTPSNVTELTSQNALIQVRIANHQNSSPTAINEALNQLTKGAHTMAYKITLMEGEIASLRKANEAASRRKARQKKRIQRQGALTIAEGLALVEQSNINEQVRKETHQIGRRLGGAAPLQRRCGHCREIGHCIERCPQVQEVVIEVLP
jgi:hypothetical protein